jgi:hypothetical protein
MEFKVYIAGLNGFPDTDWGRSAWMGFKEKGTFVKVFEFIDQVPANRWHIVVAGVKETYEYLAKLDIHPRKTLNVPEELMKYADRHIEFMTLGEFKKDTRLPIFVKPNGKNKQFDAGVMTMESSRGFFDEHPDDTEVMVSEPHWFASEYRCYVIEGELVGIKHYKGNIRIFPDVSVIDACIRDYKDAPAGYSVDVGISESDGKTRLIECQDGWSLGNYGLEDEKYTKLISRRWMQFLKEGR